jgi:glycosidase
MPFARDTTEILKVVAADRKEINMIFIFDIVNVDDDPFRFSIKQWKPRDVAGIISKWQTELVRGGGWPSIFLENHDHPRSVTRFTDDSPATRALGAKLLALMQTTLGGTLYLYQGEEIGMKNVPASWDAAEYKDIETVNYWQKMLDASNGDINDPKMAEAKRIIQRKARDHARTPVQWTGGANAGFCAEGVEPWMRVNEDWKEINVEAQLPASSASSDADASPGSSDKLSVWQFWQRGLKNRKAHKDVFVYGSFEALDVQNENVFAYQRVGEDGKEAFVVLLNFTGQQVEVVVGEEAKVKKWVAGNYEGHGDDIGEKEVGGRVVLRPWEGVLGTAEI